MILLEFLFNVMDIVYVTHPIIPTQNLCYRVSITLLIFLHIFLYHTSLLAESGSLFIGCNTVRTPMPEAATATTLWFHTRRVVIANITLSCGVILIFLAEGKHKVGWPLLLMAETNWMSLRKPKKPFFYLLSILVISE